MPRAHGVSGGVRSIAFVAFFLSFARAAGAQMYSNVPSGSGESIDGSIIRTDTSCTVTSGKYVLKSTQLRMDIENKALALFVPEDALGTLLSRDLLSGNVQVVFRAESDAIIGAVTPSPDGSRIAFKERLLSAVGPSRPLTFVWHHL